MFSNKNQQNKKIENQITQIKKGQNNFITKKQTICHHISHPNYNNIKTVIVVFVFIILKKLKVKILLYDGNFELTYIQ